MLEDVLEKPTAVENAPREVSGVATIVTDAVEHGVRSARQNVSSKREPLRLRQRIEVQLRKVFEGREEFLGYTPD